VILREEEIPIEWFTSNGTKVTGRPDMVVCKREETLVGTSDTGNFYTQTTTPLWGVELKSVHSVWVSRDVLGENRPKVENLLQAAHYAWKVGVPFKLAYKQYSIQEIPGWKGAKGMPGWSQKLFPKPGMPGSEFIDYEKGRVQQYEIVYEIDIAQDSRGTIRYRKESIANDTPWTKTLLCRADIERYYYFASKMSQEEKLGPRPMAIGADGKEKNYSKCDYCPLEPVCSSHEGKGYQAWLQEVKTKLGVK
jgi:hypothetical protein